MWTTVYLGRELVIRHCKLCLPMDKYIIYKLIHCFHETTRHLLIPEHSAGGIHLWTPNGENPQKKIKQDFGRVLDKGWHLHQHWSMELKVKAVPPHKAPEVISCNNIINVFPHYNHTFTALEVISSLLSNLPKLPLPSLYLSLVINSWLWRLYTTGWLARATSAETQSFIQSENVCFASPSTSF